VTSASDPGKDDIFEELKRAEIHQQGRSRSRLSATSLVLLAYEGVDLETQW
jgi:hypothetical protein